MITVYPVLRQRMEEHGVTCGELAAVVGDDLITFYSKMWGIKRWTLADAVKICGFFRCPEAEHLFVRNYNNQQFLESQGKNNHL